MWKLSASQTGSTCHITSCFMFRSGREKIVMVIRGNTMPCYLKSDRHTVANSHASMFLLCFVYIDLCFRLN